MRVEAQAHSKLILIRLVNRRITDEGRPFGLSMPTTVPHGVDIMRVRTLFLSDIHLGCRFSQSERLFGFLGHFEPDRLYLVGDIIDGWKMKRGFSWNDTARDLLSRRGWVGVAARS